ncbi:putative ribonuclease H-like domain-containing protein [Tanacetum coccineum]|uniref:Ribonuclease H-like domain-containing protein n=1 Tax=Tanacetum coccineum TaxID=301880 RepID=A0ABQ5ECY5_9ASTR
MIYEDFDQVDQLEMEEMDLKWQMAMLSLRINRFEKKAGRKMNYNNQQPARFDRRKVRCYKCLQLGHFARECNVKTVDDKARYSAFKVTEVKSDEPKALVSVDSMVNWSDHAAENKTGEVEKVYGMMAGLHADNGGADASDAAAEFAMMGISPKAGEMHAVPPSITGTYMPSPYKSDIEKTQVSYGSKSDNKTSETISESNDFVSCDNNSVPCKSKGTLFPAGVGIRHNITRGSVPAASRNRPAANVLQIDHTLLVGLKDTTVSLARDDGVLLLRPQQVTLGGIKDHIFGVPRVMGDPSTDNDIGIVDSGCSRSMTGNKEKLDDFVQIKGGIVKFRGGDGRISGKGTIRTSKLDFENVYYVEELQHFNLFSVSQICDKKNKVLFTDTDCLVLSEEFQLPDASQVVLRIPRKHDLYTFHISDLQPEQKVTCLVAKASLDESTRWHRRMAHSSKMQNLMNSVGKSGIKRTKAILEPTTNCVAERKNRTLIEGVLEPCWQTPKLPTILGLRLLHVLHQAMVLVFMNQCRIYAEVAAKLQRQEYEAKDAAARYGYLFSQATAEILCQAEAEIRNQGVSAVRDPASIDSAVRDPAGIDSAVRDPAGIISAGGVSAGSPSAGSDPAGGNPAGTFQPAGSFDPAALGDPAVSTSVSADFIPVHADASTLPPGQVLGSSENTTRFPVPSDVCKDQISSGIFTSSSYDDDFRATLTNLAPAVEVNPVPTKRVNTIHPQSQILGDLASPVMTRSRAQKSKFGESAFIGYIQDQQRTNHTDQLHCLSACFLSQLEPTSIAKALEDPDWVDAMQEEMQQFINQQVWKLVPLPAGKHAIGTKWILKNKRDARGIVVRNKARLVAQGHRQEEGIDYDEVFAPVARIEAIRLFLAFASYMGFLVYQLDVKSAFLYGEIEEEVYVTQPKGFEDPYFPKHVYRVVKALYGLHQAPRACLPVKQLPDGIFISQDKYVKDMLTKFDMESVRTATTPYEAAKTKLKDETDPPVNVHLYRSMIGSLMYLTASRPDIMFAVSACSRLHVTSTDFSSNAVQENF